MTEDIEVVPVTSEQAYMVRVTGALTAGTAEDALGKLADATVVLLPPALVVLDLWELELLSAAGARTLATFAAGCADRGVRAAVLLDPAGVHGRVLRSAVPAATLPVHVSLADAIGAEPAERPDADRLGDQLAALTRVLLDATSVGQALTQVVAATTVVVPHARLVSITLRDPGGRFFTPIDAPPVAADLDDVQYRTGAGPCLDASTPDGPAFALEQNLTGTTPWPQFAAVATAHGLGAVLSTALLPTSGPATVHGALNIYAHSDGITETDRHRALLLATHASLALQHARNAEIAELEQAHLRRAIASRDVIGQAKGILMARQGLDADAAFALLRRSSQSLNVKLADIAAALVGNHTKLLPPDRR